MENQFVDYETSKKLKELGFDEPCICLHDDFMNDVVSSGVMISTKRMLPVTYSQLSNPKNITIPMWQQVKEWFWKNKHYSLTVRMIGNQYTYEIWNDKTKRFIEYGVKYYSPIEAEKDGIKNLVEILYNQTAVAVTPNEVQK